MRTAKNITAVVLIFLAGVLMGCFAATYGLNEDPQKCWAIFLFSPWVYPSLIGGMIWIIYLLKKE